MIKDAFISADEKYRYALWRTWDEKKPKTLFVMLNPSTADANNDDPTIRRCIAFAESWGHGGIIVGNLFAYRATDPKELLKADNPKGPANDCWLKNLFGQAELIICAWGNEGSLKDAGKQFREFARKTWRQKLHYLKMNKSGEPAHPLYLSKTLRPIEWEESCTPKSEAIQETGKGLRYGSVCSGVEAATLAWELLGWKAAFFAEIEPFPCRVLMERFDATSPLRTPKLKGRSGKERRELKLNEKTIMDFPKGGSIPNFGDFTRIKKENLDGVAIDVLVGGTPCQGFSIAGLRKGLDDNRSGLAVEFLKLARRTRARWVVWENVPGALSSWSGEPEYETFEEWAERNDFDQFLSGFQECGYGVMYRVLDAQYVRVDGFGRAVPQRRRRVFAVGYLGDWRCAAAVLFEQSCMSGDTPPSRKAGQGAARGFEVGPSGGHQSEVSGTLDTRCKDGAIRNQAGMLVGARMRAFGDYEIDGAASTIKQRDHKDATDLIFCYENHPNDSRVKEHGNLSPTIPSRAGTGGGNLPLVAFQNQASASQSMNPDVVCPSIDTSKVPSVAGFLPGQGSKAKGIGYEEGTSPTLRAGCDSYGIINAMSVRRLTPLECERLMGFPDNHTRIPWNGKPVEDCPDSHRYKACGNSMCVNVMRWIGKRIQMVENLIGEMKG